MTTDKHGDARRLIPCQEDLQALAERVGSFCHADVNPRDRETEQFLDQMLLVAEYAFVFGQLISASMGRITRFVSSVEDYATGTFEHESEFAFSQLSLSMQHVLVYHDLNLEGSPIDPPPPLLAAAVVPTEYSVDLSAISVFEDTDLDSLLRCYYDWWLFPWHREQEEQMRFLPPFCRDLLKFARLCLIYWHALYKLLYDAPEDPFGALTDKLSEQLRDCPPQQLFAICLVSLKQITTFRDGTKDFYDAVESLNERDMYR